MNIHNEWKCYTIVSSVKQWLNWQNYFKEKIKVNELAAQENLINKEMVSDIFSAHSWATVLNPVWL